MKLLAFPVLFISVTVFGQQVNTSSMADTIFRSYFKENEPGGAILVLRENKVVYSNAIGLADINTNEKISTKTLFNLGSISKPIVAYGILKLAEDRKLSLDDNLLKYFPDFRNKDIAKKIKLYHLLTHTSGLPDSRRVSEEHEFYLTAKDEENFAPLLMTDTLEFEPGSRYKYSNPAFNGLALIIEKVSGEKWQDYVRKHILVPAGMMTSTITDGPHPETGVSHAYVRLKDGGFAEMDYGEEPTFAAAGNGGVWSSVEELWLLEQAIQQNKFLSTEWLDRSRTRYSLPNWADKDQSRLGLSWFITIEMSKEMIGHTGSQGGFISDYVWIPELQVFYVLLCNTPKPIIELRQKMLNALLR